MTVGVVALSVVVAIVICSSIASFAVDMPGASQPLSALLLQTESPPSPPPTSPPSPLVDTKADERALLAGVHFECDVVVLMAWTASSHKAICMKHAVLQSFCTILEFVGKPTLACVQAAAHQLAPPPPNDASAPRPSLSPTSPPHTAMGLAALASLVTHHLAVALLAVFAMLRGCVSGRHGVTHPRSLALPLLLLLLHAPHVAAAAMHEVSAPPHDGRSPPLPALPAPPAPPPSVQVSGRRLSDAATMMAGFQRQVGLSAGVCPLHSYVLRVAAF